MRNKCVLSISLSALAAVVLPALTRACTIVYPTVQVGRTFRVQVTDRGRAITSLKLWLNLHDSSGSRHDAPISSVTDGSGYAYFSNVIPGSFFLSADHDGPLDNAIIVEAKRTGHSGVTAPLNWPNRTPIRVRSAAGAVRGPITIPSRRRFDSRFRCWKGPQAV
jgi:hypothetical protein